MYKLLLETTDRKFHKIFLFNTSEDTENAIDSEEGEFDTVQTIKSILKRNKLKLSDISKISVNKGPGSFTGIKMGISVANILNWQLFGKKIEELDKPEYGREPEITAPNQPFE